MQTTPLTYPPQPLLSTPINTTTSTGTSITSSIGIGLNNKAPLLTYRTPFMGYACEWSPFEENKLAIATAQHFGIVGNGRQHVVRVNALDIKNNNNDSAPLQDLAIYNTRDGIYDVCWSEVNENHLVSGCGDGTLRLWDMKSKHNPLRAYIGHNSEVYSVAWNVVSKNHFISGSWDQTVRLWDPMRGECLNIFTGHTGLIYGVSWAPYQDSVLASVSEDLHLNLWDARKGKSPPILSVTAHGHEILTCDFSKYNGNVIATGACDLKIHLWDLRKIVKPWVTLSGHKFAVRKIRFSPHYPTQLLSVSYDMSTCLWDYMALPNPLLMKYNHHKEFAIGCSYNLFVPNLIATTGWDNQCHIYQLPNVPLKNNPMHDNLDMQHQSQFSKIQPQPQLQFQSQQSQLQPQPSQSIEKK